MVVVRVEGFAGCEFRHVFRRYQQRALVAVEELRQREETRAYLVLPPGAGKTALGLEIARRLGRRTLVLTPNTAVQGQWLDTWTRDFDPDRAVPAAADRELDRDLTVLTYQSLAVFDRDEEDGSARRRDALRAGDSDTLLDLLHPNGRELVTRAAATGPWTLVLDECHHLLAVWGALVRAFVDELGEHTNVVGLTATPPRFMTRREHELHDELFGTADFEVPTPALVKEGDLAPYRELAYLTTPTVEEDTWLATERSRFAQLQLDLVDRQLGTVSFVEWLARRVTERLGESGGVLSWREFALAEPDLARAGLRFAHAGLLPLPDGARLREEHRMAPAADDWVTVLTDYCTGHLAGSDDPTDVAALQAIRTVLPSLGYRLTRQGVRVTMSPVDRVCGLSEAKIAGAVHLLSTEHDALGDALRALVLCDFEEATARLSGRLAEAPLTTQSGSARLAFATLAGADVGGVGGLRPMLVTGRTLACGEKVATDFVSFCAHVGERVSLQEWDSGLYRVVAESSRWTARRWAALATSFFAAGGARVLVGTRALLGEGWDCPVVNVTVDLTTAATPTSVTQMRGRSLRIDPARRDKVANNWTVCCIAPDHPRGDADYLRLVRKHDAYLSVTDSGEIESGVSHCDPVLSPYGPPAVEEIPAVTGRALRAPDARAEAMARWRIGQPYDGVDVGTVRVRASRPMGAVGDALPASARAPARPPRRRRGAVAGVAAACAGLGTVTGVTESVAAGASVGSGSAAAATLVGLAIPAVWRARQLADSEPSGALERLARAVADGLHDAGGSDIGASGVLISPTSDGWLRCTLDGVPEAQSTLFAVSLDELLAPLEDPRHLVGRVIVTPPSRFGARLAYAARATLGLDLEAAVSWHAVPTWCAAGSRRLRIFLAAWERHVGPARHLEADSPEGQAILDLFRGEDPFSVVTQLRTVWR